MPKHLQVKIEISKDEIEGIIPEMKITDEEWNHLMYAERFVQYEDDPNYFYPYWDEEVTAFIVRTIETNLTEFRKRNA